MVNHTLNTIWGRTKTTKIQNPTIYNLEHYPFRQMPQIIIHHKQRTDFLTQRISVAQSQSPVSLLRCCNLTVPGPSGVRRRHRSL